MAGIAGIAGKNDDALKKIIERIKHRGPHETWIKKDDKAGIGCCELNVGGDRKKGSHYAEKDGIAVVIDGRVYNDGMEGYTDAEAVLKLYEKYGSNFAENLNGDFACAVKDKDELILARDWAGVKPLYYGHDGQGNLVFASEAKSFPGLSRDVREFPPGYVYSRKLGFRKFKLTAVETPEYENYDQAKKVVRRLLEEAVEKRMKDNSVQGILLSGGLDSSLITYMAAQINPDIECFTVSMAEGKDLPLAKDVTKYLGLKHHVMIFGEKEIGEILPQAVHYQEMFEESCVHGAIANFLAARYVKPHTNSIMTGEGADELYYGYDGQYKQVENPEETARVLDFLLNTAHNTALQRLDRLNAANSIESRTPFLDPKVMDFALKIPKESKIHGPERTGKWILRQAFDGALPEHIIYQTKRFFAQGSGVASIMRSIAEKKISEEELHEHNKKADAPFLASVEELYYYKLFKETFPDPCFDRLVGRWDPFRSDFFRR